MSQLARELRDSVETGLLGSLLGQGGEGAVCKDARSPVTAVKIYKDFDPERGAKLEMLVSLDSPKLRTAAAWPRSIVHGADGRVVGFEMEFLEGWVPLFSVYQTRSRMKSMPAATWLFLLRVARNLATCVHYVHAAGLVVGDLNESNVLISGRGMAKIIDVDSFQIDRFACRVGKSELTPPEFQGVSGSGSMKTREHDKFALAVLIFQTLVFGRHPYAGRTDTDEDLTLEDCIKNGWYAYSCRREAPVVRPPGLNLDFLPPYLTELFERSFDVEVTERPSALEFFEALQRLEQETTVCGPNPTHVYWSGSPGCPFCRLEELWRVQLFTNPGDRNLTVEVEEIDTAGVWQAILAIKEPDVVDAPTLKHYAEFSPAKLPWYAKLNTLVSFAYMPIFFTQLFNVRFIVYGISFVAAVAGLGMYGHLRRKRIGANVGYVDVKQFCDLYSRAKGLCSQWDDTTQRVFAKALEDLEEVKERCEDSEGHMRAITVKILMTFRKAEINQHLDRFSVLGSGIVDVRLHNLLVSYRVRTAADCMPENLDPIDELRDDQRKALIVWRETILRHYMSTGPFPLTREQEVLARKTFQRERRELCATLQAGPARLAELRKELEAAQRVIILDAQKEINEYERIAPLFHALVKCGHVPSTNNDLLALGTAPTS